MLALLGPLISTPPARGSYGISENAPGHTRRRSAERGDLESQQKLAEFLAKGRGIPKNEPEALEWYRKAADEGLP